MEKAFQYTIWMARRGKNSAVKSTNCQKEFLCVAFCVVSLVVVVVVAFVVCHSRFMILCSF